MLSKVRPCGWTKGKPEPRKATGTLWRLLAGGKTKELSGSTLWIWTLRLGAARIMN